MTSEEGLESPALQCIPDRGALIVFEGLPRSGKSNLSRVLTNYLQSLGHRVLHLSFPDKKTCSGHFLASSITNKTSHIYTHLMYVINRWEWAQKIYDYLEAGITLIIDRYSYSNIAHSVPNDFDFGWCFELEKCVVQPDRVFLVYVDIDEIIEASDYDLKVSKNVVYYERMLSVYYYMYLNQLSLWKLIAGNDNLKSLVKNCSEDIIEVMRAAKQSPITYLNMPTNFKPQYFSE